MAGFFKLVGFVLFWIVLAVVTFGAGLLLLIPYWLLVIRNSEARAVKAEEKLNGALMKDEKILTQGIQGRIYALWSRRDLVAITNSRMILIQRSIFGGFSMSDHQWKDLCDARYSENIIPNVFGAKLRFMRRGGAGIVIDGLSSQVASGIYSHAQAQEQEWEEKNRIRLLEEKRAMSGASVVQVGHAGTGAAPKDSGVDMFQDIEKAKKLLDGGVISDAEYQELKAKIISKGA
jgi:hypothetical protein